MFLNHAFRKFSLEPVLMEEYEDDHKVTSVAVVKKASSFQKWSDLQGHKACLSDVGEAAGKYNFQTMRQNSSTAS